MVGPWISLSVCFLQLTSLRRVMNSYHLILSRKCNGHQLLHVKPFVFILHYLEQCGAPVCLAGWHFLLDIDGGISKISSTVRCNMLQIVGSRRPLRKFRTDFCGFPSFYSRLTFWRFGPAVAGPAAALVGRWVTYGLVFFLSSSEETGGITAVRPYLRLSR